MRAIITLHIKICMGGDGTIILNLHLILDIFLVLGFFFPFLFLCMKEDKMSQHLEAESPLNYVLFLFFFLGREYKSSSNSQKGSVTLQCSSHYSGPILLFRYKFISFDYHTLFTLTALSHARWKLQRSLFEAC